MFEKSQGILAAERLHFAKWILLWLWEFASVSRTAGCGAHLVNENDWKRQNMKKTSALFIRNIGFELFPQCYWTPQSNTFPHVFSGMWIDEKRYKSAGKGHNTVPLSLGFSTGPLASRLEYSLTIYEKHMSFLVRLETFSSREFVIFS